MPVAVELLIAGDAPHVGGDAVLLEHRLSRQHLVQDRAAAEQVGLHLGLVGGGPEQVHAFDDAVAGAFGHRRHLVLFVHHRDVVEDVLLLLVHAADAVLDDDRELVSKGRIVGNDVGIAQRHDVTVPVLVLQPFPGERRPARGAAQQEPAGAGIGGRPDQVADPLEAEHRVIDEERDRVDAVIRVGGAGGNEG